MDLVKLKAKFAMTSAIATLIDYVIYVFLVYTICTPLVANTISYTIAATANFMLQKKFVFAMERKQWITFGAAILVSLLGLLLSNGIIWWLNHYSFFQTYQFITKLAATGLVFFWNFYMKRFVFEKRFW